jgi:hypothetical protein
MSPSLRFLAIAVIGWGGLRAATLGMLPGAPLFEIAPSQAKAPPIMATVFPPIEPLAAAPDEAAAQSFTPAAIGVAASPSRPHYAPIPWPARPARYRTQIIPEPAPAFYASVPALDQWPLARLAAASSPPLKSNVAIPGQSIPEAIRKAAFDRIQLTSWAMLRSPQALSSSPSSLASGGTLGGSQAGARLAYNFNRQLSATLRTTSAVGKRGGEVALGARIQPLGGIPLWVTAERRQRLGRYGGGRNAFALFLEGGAYDRPMPWRFRLDAYFQGGVVGLHHRDRFVDGALTMTRPVYKNFSAGLGLWGGAQPGVYRVDAGPRVTMRVRNNVKVHLDYRQRLAGNAEPGSGPALTLAGDF